MCGCDGVASLPDGFSALSALQRLNLRETGQLVSLPVLDGCSCMPLLQSILVVGSDGIEELEASMPTWLAKRILHDDLDMY